MNKLNLYQQRHHAQKIGTTVEGILITITRNVMQIQIQDYFPTRVVTV